MPVSGWRMGSNRSMFSYITVEPKKPLKVKLVTDMKGQRVEGKKPTPPKKKKGSK